MGIALIVAILSQEPGLPEPVQGLDVAVRFTDLGGDLDDESKWGDFFDAGVGFEVGYQYLHPVSRKIHIGGYVRTALDRFAGDEADVSDEFGPLFATSDDMTLFRFTLGGRIRETFKAFFMEQSIGIGFMTYPDLDADVEDDLGSLGSASFVEGGTEFTFELAARFGFILSPAASIWVSFGYENNGAPEVGSDLDDGTFDYENQKNFVFGLGATFSF